MLPDIPIYINGLGCISPQKSAVSTDFLGEPVNHESQPMRTVDPVYRDFIPADVIRRMGRIIKMGVAASRLCLRDAGDGQEAVPGGIITGTGLGCMEDTEKFLESMIRNKEEFLTPTSFIQSTHNTVAGQIALLLKCHSYNFTYVHRGVSFESALTDAMIQLASGNLRSVLAGGLDETTAHSFAIMNRLGLWKRRPVGSLRMIDDPQRGSMAGEGASFFFLENERKEKTYARLRGVTTFRNPTDDAGIARNLTAFLEFHQAGTREIDLFMPGLSGDPRGDRVYRSLMQGVFKGMPVAAFKPLCGEYHTASAFALWVGAKILSEQKLPEVLLYGSVRPQKEIRNILIYNHFGLTNHGAILISRA